MMGIIRAFFLHRPFVRGGPKDRRSGQKDSNFLIFRLVLAAAYSFPRPSHRNWSSLLLSPLVGEAPSFGDSARVEHRGLSSLF